MAENDVAGIKCQLADDSLLPALAVSQGVLSVLGSVLYPYQKFVKSSTPPSARRSMLLATIEKLRTRITTLTSQGAEGTRLVLTDEEVTIIDQALTFFIQSIKSMIPASQERDETLEACSTYNFLSKKPFHHPCRNEPILHIPSTYRRDFSFFGITMYVSWGLRIFDRLQDFWYEKIATKTLTMILIQSIIILSISLWYSVVA